MLSIKSITSCNINGNPLTSYELSKRIYEYKDYIKNNISKKNDFKINDNDLVIVCVQNLYGYRTGILGYLGNLLSYRLSQYNNPTLFQRIIKNVFSYEIKSNDYELLSFITSFISRKIPIINIGNWDFKKNLFDNSHIKYEQSNLSMPSIFNLSSIYLLNPLFDNGCCIYSNMVPLENGFEKYNLENRGEFKHKLFNNGINWCFFQSKNKKSGISIINLSIIKDIPDWVYNIQFKQIVELKEKLERKYALNILCKNYETFIIGDFDVDFNKRNDTFDIKEYWNIFEQSELHIISSSDKNFILYNNFINKDSVYNEIKKTTYNIKDDNITTLLFENENKVIDENEKYNVIFNDEKFETKKKFYKVLSDIKYFYKSKKEVNDEKKEDNDIVIDIKDNYFDKNIQKSPSNSSDDDWHKI